MTTFLGIRKIRKDWHRRGDAIGCSRGSFGLRDPGHPVVISLSPSPARPIGIEADRRCLCWAFWGNQKRWSPHQLASVLQARTRPITFFR